LPDFSYFNLLDLYALVSSNLDTLSLYLNYLGMSMLFSNFIEILLYTDIIGVNIVSIKVQQMNRIRELRKRLDMTQKELAKHLQIADSTLSYWEMGKYEPDSDALMKLSRFFQVPIDYILGGDFTKWDIYADVMINPGVGSSSPIDFEMSVSENLTAYNLWSEKNTFDRIEFEGLTQEEIDLLAEYAVFIKSRRKK